MGHLPARERLLYEQLTARRTAPDHVAALPRGRGTGLRGSKLDTVVRPPVQARQRRGDGPGVSLPDRRRRLGSTKNWPCSVWTTRRGYLDKGSALTSPPPTRAIATARCSCPPRAMLAHDHCRWTCRPPPGPVRDGQPQLGGHLARPHQASCSRDLKLTGPIVADVWAESPRRRDGSWALCPTWRLRRVESPGKPAARQLARPRPEPSTYGPSGTLIRLFHPFRDA